MANVDDLRNGREKAEPYGIENLITTRTRTTFVALGDPFSGSKNKSGSDVAFLS